MADEGLSSVQGSTINEAVLSREQPEVSREGYAHPSRPWTTASDYRVKPSMLKKIIRKNPPKATAKAR
jgi:hypothetical protein